MARTHFEEEKKRLNDDILKMGVRVEEDLRKAIEALKTQDTALAEEVKADDAVVNQMQTSIEDACCILIATQQPVAQDVREILTAIKVVDNLERMGDHAVHLAKAVIRLSGEPYLKPLKRIQEMAEIGCDMVRGSIAAYLDNDVAKARETARLDEGVDTLHKQIVQEIFEIMRDSPELVPQAARVLTTSGFMERFGDHATNICESVVFSATGTHVELND